MKRKIIILSSTIIVLLSLVLFKTPASSAEGPKKVAILPFTINADRDFTFLQEGILDMLNSRLALKDELEVIEKEKAKKKVAELKGRPNKETALMIGRSLQVDYVVLGSLTVFGEGVSIDARVLDVAESKELVTAFNQSKGMDKVIPMVNQFALEINSKILGRGPVPPRHAPAPKDRFAQEEEKVPGADEEEVASEPGYKGVTSEPGDMEPLLTTKVPFEIVGLDVGDVDGDGQNDLVIIDHNNVYIYRIQESRLVQFRKISGNGSDKYVSLDVADLDGNRRAEIYVSSITGYSLGSFVLEWAAGDFRSLATGEGWFFRVLNHPTKGEGLIGQQKAVSGSFTGAVYFLSVKDKEIVKGERVLSFSEANVFNFAMGDMEGKGKIDTAVLAENGDLTLIGPDGEVDLEDEGDYGGSPTFIQDTSNDDGFHSEGELVFLSPRVFMWDMDSDGKKDLVLCRNDLKTGRLLDRVRVFKSGRVLFLKKTPTGLEIRRQTGELTKCVADYQVKDVDNDGRSELVVAATAPGLWNIVGMGKGRSRLVVYELN